MTVEELAGLARTYEETILEHKLTRAEVVMLLALIDARVKEKLTSKSTVAPAPVTASIDAPATTKKVAASIPVEPTRKKSIQYDPLYDPAPPFEVESPHPPVSSSGILVQRNQACVCNACGKISYIANRDVPNDCKVDFFIEQFTPFGDAPVLTRKLEIMNVD